MAFLPGFGPTETVIVSIIAFMLFGKNLPTGARKMGKRFAEVRGRLSTVGCRSSGFVDHLHRIDVDIDWILELEPAERFS